MILSTVQLLRVILKAAIVILPLRISLWGRLLKHALCIVPLIVLNLVLPGIRLRPALGGRVGKSTKGVSV